MLKQKNNKVMDIDAKLKAVALSDNKLGLLQGKLGASIYFFVMSNHNCRLFRDSSANNIIKINRYKAHRCT